ncbi:MAG: YjbQ family protein, partial [Luteibacter jiangsuensis]
MSRAQPVQHIAQSTFTVHTRGRSLTEVTDRIAEAIVASGVGTGIAHIFVQHTSASLLVGENAD